jgi:nucleotide-binding universal stress UspA family protein
MNAIVALTDFSAAAAGAVDYAAALAKATHLPLTVVHTYIVPILYSPEALAPTLLPVAETREHAQEQLEQVLADLRSRHGNLQIEGRLALEDAEDALNSAGADNENLLVMGTVPGETHNWWEESTGLDLLQGAHRTVLAVPVGTSFTAPKRMALALDSVHLPAHIPFHRLLHWLELTGAQLQVITVGEEPVPDAVVQTLLPAKPEYHILKGAGTVDEIIIAFTEQENIDWLVVLPGVYGFWSGLFHKSHTQALAEKARTPLLALHAEK